MLRHLGMLNFEIHGVRSFLKPFVILAVVVPAVWVPLTLIGVGLGPGGLEGEAPPMPELEPPAAPARLTASTVAPVIAAPVVPAAPVDTAVEPDELRVPPRLWGGCELDWAAEPCPGGGLPAISPDGSLIVATYSMEDGGRGYPNLHVEYVPTDGSETHGERLLEAEEVAEYIEHVDDYLSSDSSKLPSRLREVVDRRAERITLVLGLSEFTSMKPIPVIFEDDDDALRSEVLAENDVPLWIEVDRWGEKERVVHASGRTLWRASEGDPGVEAETGPGATPDGADDELPDDGFPDDGFPDDGFFDECAPEGVCDFDAWYSAEHDLILIEAWHCAGGCFCDAVVEHRVIPVTPPL